MPHPETAASGYDALLQVAIDEFRDKQGRFAVAVADYPSWDIDNVASTISFSREGQPPLIWAITPIGTWMPEELDWAWGWANDAFSEDARERSAALKALAERTGDARFGQGWFHAHADDVGELCALAIHQLQSDAQFRTVDELRCYDALRSL